MLFRLAKKDEFESLRKFYWNLIDEMRGQSDKIGWKKGIYPTDEFLRESLDKKEMYVLEENGKICASAIINSDYNEGYADIPWSFDCREDEVLIPHALAVSPSLQGRGIGKLFVKEIISLAKKQGKKAMRLDTLGTNTAAQKLYLACGFKFVKSKNLFYEDTGLTEYKMYELVL